jgi:hypothetical protein
MAKEATITRKIVINGMTLNQTKEAEGGRDAGIIVTCNIAKAGTLTVRTDADTGTFVSTAGGHGIVDADRVTVFWATGSRHGMTVGTVSGTSIPLDGGTGDDLPAATTAMNICKEVEKEFVFDVADCEAFGIKGPAQDRVHVTLAIADNTEKYAKLFEADQCVIWADGDETCPISTGAITKVFCSSDDTVAARDVKLAVLLA